MRHTLRRNMSTPKRKSRGKTKAPYRTNLGSLKLEAPLDEEFKEALLTYGFESVPAFIRQCAFTLLRQKDAKLILPLEFRVAN
jgi:hypothetical protein